MKPIACPKCQSTFEPVISDSRFSCPSCKTVFEIYQKEGRNLARIVPDEVDEIDAITEQQVKCPYCREWIMDGAVVCRFCGRNINPDNASDSDSDSDKDEKNTFPLKWVIIGSIAVLFLLLGVFGIFIGSKTVDMSKINLTPLLIVDGDLPAGLTAGQIITANTDDSVHSYVNFSSRKIVKNDENVGSVKIWLFDSQSNVDAGLNAIKPQKNNIIIFDTDIQEIMDVKDVGETAYGLLTHDYAGITDFSAFGTLVFKRCHAIVYISLPTDTQFIEITTYAKNIDKRITPIVCKK